MIILDLTDKLTRFPIPYGWQPVRGWPVKHFDTTLSQSTQRTKQHALGEGPWDFCEGLWTDGIVIPEADFVFHPGIGSDTPDINFPTDAAHPWTAYISAKCPAGLSEDRTDKLFGIYRTLRTGNYNGAGQQLNSSGVVVAPSDPRDEYFFKPNPANVAVDQLLRWGKRLNSIVNWPAWVDWRDFNDELIPWDDSSYTPRAISLTPTSGGSLTPGQTYYIRVSTMKSGDESSASMKTIETKANSITLLGGQTAFQVNWIIKGDEKVPAENPAGITGYRIYVGTSPGIWLGYFGVTNPITRSFIITTTGGVSAGNPLELATSGLLRNIKRFECGLFFIPPFDLAVALDRICQISCADWQWSGLGTGTYRNDKVRFMTPANRSPVFTLNLAETGMGSFRTYPIDRRSRPNQIIVNFRDRDDEFLNEAEPVILNREQLQIDDKQTKAFTIEAGSMYRSQAQRVASFFARVLCDMDQMVAMKASPKSYHMLPGDVLNVTNDTPDWTDVEFVVRRKGENIESGIGDPIVGQLYDQNLYSDTDYSPVSSPLPAPRIDPFEEPPVVEDVTLEFVITPLVTGQPVFNIKGTVEFAPFHSKQIGRVWWWKPGGVDFEPTGIIVTPDPVTLIDIFTVNNVVIGTHKFKVVTESALGASKPLVEHPEFEISLEGFVPVIEAPTGIVVHRDQTKIVQVHVPPREHNLGETVKYWVDILKSGVNFTANFTTNVFTSTAHQLKDGDMLIVSNSGGGLPPELVIETNYHVRDVTTNTFKLSQFPGQPAIDITTNGTGTHSFHKMVRHLLVTNRGTWNPSIITIYTPDDTPPPDGEWQHSNTAGSGGWDSTVTTEWPNSNNILGDGPGSAGGGISAAALALITETGAEVEFTLGSVDYQPGIETSVFLASPEFAENGSSIVYREIRFTLFTDEDLPPSKIGSRRWKLSIYERAIPTGPLDLVYTDPDLELPKMRYRFQLSGSELRYYRNPTGPNSTLLYRSTTPLILPLRLRADVSTEHSIENVKMGGLVDCITTYPDSDMMVDFGSEPSTLRIRVYEERIYSGAIFLGQATDFIT